MTEPVGRRAGDAKMHEKIDAVIIDLNNFRRGFDGSLNIITGRIDTISTDLATHKNDVAKLSEGLGKVVESLASIHDILIAWNSIQGFGKVVKFLSVSAKMVMPIMLVVGLGGAIVVAGWSWVKAHVLFK
jgi:hypothetical protein